MEGKLEIREPGGNGAVTIAVDPGKHRLKVEKAGFVVFGQDFEIDAGGQLSITATIVPASAAAGPNKPWNTTAFQQWMKAVAALPAGKQVEAVAKKLQDLNPGFDGINSVKTANGVVTEFQFATDTVTDISPVRTLPGLRKLTCSGSGQSRGILSDLSPLKGMSLTLLDCSDTRVSDLSPLHGMPLAFCACGTTKVTDLSPLKGMPLEQLWCGSSPVSDLSPLHGMPLQVLACDNTHVSDLSPLQGMNIEVIYLTPRVITKGMAAIRQMKSLTVISNTWAQKWPPAEFWKKYDAGEFGKAAATLNDPAFQQWMKNVAALPADKQIEAVVKKLQELNPGFDGKVTDKYGNGPPKIENGIVTELRCPTDHVTDISPVRALPGLKCLFCGGSSKGTGVLSDLSPLQGMRLTCLNCGWSPPISDLSPLRGMPLAMLIFDLDTVSDLSPLQGMRLTDLSCVGTPVSDLSPLKGAPLGELICGGTNVADLSPLKGMPLTRLACNSTEVSDLSPLEGMSLNEVYFTPKNIAKGLDAIRRMKNIKTIGLDGHNKYSPAEFWKKYDTGEFGKPNTTLDDPAFQKWMRDVVALPADKQVEAVAKKLQELNPGFDGKVHGTNGPPKIESGVVTDFGFSTRQVSDISPVRALSGLKILHCGGGENGDGRLTDLSPLEGMKLTGLACHLNPALRDLSPLKSMPLNALGFYGTGVTDLTPLRGMKLTRISFTPKNITRGIDTIRQMQSLTSIELGWRKEEIFTPAEFWKKYDAGEFGNPTTAIDDPSLHEWMKEIDNPAFQEWMKGVAALSADKQIEAVVKKLQELNPGFDGKVFGANGPPRFENGVVTDFGFATDQVSDISPVRALAFLKILHCGASNNHPGKLADLSPLAGMRLQRLSCQFNPIADLSPLAGMPLVELRCFFTDVGDLSPLKGMPLTVLNCGHTKVANLEPLRGLPLATLVCDNTPVSDLSPLRETNLAKLLCDGARVSDLSPLRGMKLTSIVFTPKNITRGMDAIRQMKSLTTIGLTWEKKDLFTPDEFWKKYDAGEFGKPNAAVTGAATDSDRSVAQWYLAKVREFGAHGFLFIRAAGEIKPVYSVANLPDAPFQIVRLGLNKATDKDLPTLAQLAGLAELNLIGADVSDAGLDQLRDLRTLEKLNLHQTNVTAAGVAALQKALPNCKIEWVGPTKAAAPK